MVKKILIVEDNRHIAMEMRLALEARGFAVELTTDGVSAMEMAFNLKPDLILLDLVIPKLDGFLVLEGLKKDPATRSIPVIVISVKAAEEDIQHARALGASDYLVKPFEPKVLAEAVKRTLDSLVKETDS
jgi:DNA-binding response OmpR family regulator